MIDYDKLINWPFPEISHEWTKRDTMIYALGIGLGADPLDKHQLRFVYEKALLALPSMATVLCAPGNWLRDPRTGVDYLHVMNGGTRFVIHRPLPVEGIFTCTPRVVDIVDKGKGKGAIILVERKIFDKASSGEPVCTVTTRTFCRGDGGFGGPNRPQPAPPKAPGTPPQASVEISTPRNAALIYRLNGDANPIHADPEVARAAGFKEPILHGLCTFGVATHALVKGCCDYDPSRLKSVDARYTTPVIPGDTIRTDIWREGSIIRFRSVVPARDAVVLDYAQAEISA